jgi:quercetin dioxygenase-like cupin family protein
MTRGRRQLRRLGLVATVLLTCPLSAQSGQTTATRPAGQMPNFTGVVANLDASDLRCVRFKYDAGARSYWHTHDGPLMILVEQGRGRAQIKGQKIEEFGLGGPFYLPAKVPHWHGAAAKESVTWVAEYLGGAK